MLFFAGLAPAAGTILVWGDSLSAGYGLEKGQDWPTLLQTRLQAEGFRHVVVNGSVSGETSSGGRSRLPDALAEHSPTLVILELGANDGLRGLKPQLLADNLGAMIDAAVQARLDALNTKNFAEADRIRAELLAQGIQLMDSKDPETGARVTKWEMKR